MGKVLLVGKTTWVVVAELGGIRGIIVTPFLDENASTCNNGACFVYVA